jgi:hypothetical protein
VIDIVYDSAIGRKAGLRRSCYVLELREGLLGSSYLL